jgi:signal transduction histidine kinase
MPDLHWATRQSRGESRLERREAPVTGAVCIIDAEDKVVCYSSSFTDLVNVAAGTSLRDSVLGRTLLALNGSVQKQVLIDGTRYVAQSAPLTNANGKSGRVIALTNAQDLEEPVRPDDVLLQPEVLRLFSSIYHQVANVLTPASLYLSMAQRQAENQETTAMLSNVDGQLEKLRLLMKKFREYYQEPGLSLDTTDVKRIVDSALNDLGLAAGAAWHPPTTSGLDIVVTADLQKMKRVLEIVLANAWEAMEGTTDRNWSVDARQTDAGVSVTVKDNGRGLDAQTRANLFTPFFSTKAAQGGGLGLVIAKRIIEAHGGHIALTGEAGYGATARIELPRNGSADAT